jgi:L-lactate utilization protein LutB
LSERRQSESEQKTNQLKAEIALQELSQALELSSGDVTKQIDKYISNLRKAIEAMGGKLEIVAHFPDREIEINNFSELAELTISSNRHDFDD